MTDKEAGRSHANMSPPTRANKGANSTFYGNSCGGAPASDGVLAGQGASSPADTQEVEIQNDGAPLPSTGDGGRAEPGAAQCADVALDLDMPPRAAIAFPSQRHPSLRNLVFGRAVSKSHFKQCEEEKLQVQQASTSVHLGALDKRRPSVVADSSSDAMLGGRVTSFSMV